MGGFYPSSELRKFREQYPGFKLSFDMIDEILEQCIVLTEENEKAAKPSTKFPSGAKVSSSVAPEEDSGWVIGDNGKRVWVTTNASSFRKVPKEELRYLDGGPEDMMEDPRVLAALEGMFMVKILEEVVALLQKEIDERTTKASL